MLFLYFFFVWSEFSKYTICYKIVQFPIKFQQKYMMDICIDREVDGHSLIVRKTKYRSNQNFYGEEWKDLPRVLQPWQKETFKIQLCYKCLRNSAFFSVTHLCLSGVLQTLLHVLPSQGMTFVPGLARGVHRDWLAAGGTARLGMTLAAQVTHGQCNSPWAVQTQLCWG